MITFDRLSFPLLNQKGGPEKQSSQRNRNGSTLKLSVAPKILQALEDPKKRVDVAGRFQDDLHKKLVCRSHN